MYERDERVAAAGPIQPGSPAHLALQKLRLLAGAMASGALFAMVALFVFDRFNEPTSNLAAPWLPALLVVVGAGLLVAAPLVERSLLSQPVDPYADPRSPADESLSRYVSVRVATLGMREAVAGLGLVTGVLGQPLYGFALGACSLIALALAWPRPEQVTAHADRAGGPGRS